MCTTWFCFSMSFEPSGLRKSCNSAFCLFLPFHSGEELTITLPDLRPATDYHARYAAGKERMLWGIWELQDYCGFMEKV